MRQHPKPQKQPSKEFVQKLSEGLGRTVIAASQIEHILGVQRWSRFSGQNGGLAKVDSGFGYAANFSSSACVA
jgi:hypothetical protein